MKIHPPYKSLLTVTPYPFQLEGVCFAIKHHYCLLAHEMGLGKTLQALVIAFLMIAKGKKVLIVVPAFLRINWFLEIDKLAKHFYEIVLIEKGDDIITKISKNTDIIIMGYSMVDERVEHIFTWADLVIADEAHYLKNIEAKRTTEFHRLVYETMPERLILLTGTPMPNGVTELYSPLRLLGYTPKNTNGKNVFVDYDIPYPFYKDFAYEVNIRQGGFIRTKYEGLKNKELLKTYLKDKMIREYCKDVLNLPALLEKDIAVAYDDYPPLLKDFEEFNSDDTYTPQAKAKSALLKAPFTAAYAKNLVDSGLGPVLIYTDHVLSCEKIADLLKCPHIKGNIAIKRRDELVKKFQGGELNYLVNTIGSGAEGRNLTKANHIIANDPSWIPAKNEQFRKRIHRIGQDKSCYIHNILGSIQDKKILRSLRKKMQVIGEIL